MRPVVLFGLSAVAICLFLATGVQADMIFSTTDVQADPIPSGSVGFSALSPSSASPTGNITTATTFTLGSWTALFGDGVFAGIPLQSFGSLSFDITSPTSLTFGNSVFGTFASTSIMNLGGTPFVNLSVLGEWTPGTFGGVTGGPFASQLSLTFSQTPLGTGPISASGTFATPAETPVPEPSSIFLVLKGLATGLVSYRLRRPSASGQSSRMMS